MKKINLNISPERLQMIKTIFNIVLIITGIIFLFWIMRAVYNKWFKSEEDKQGTEENQQKNSMDVVSNDLEQAVIKNPLSYPLSIYDSLSSLLIAKLEYYPLTVGAKYSDVFPVLTKLKNYADILQYKKSFDKRQVGNKYLFPMVTLDEAIGKYTDYQTQAFWKELQRAFSQSKSLNKK